MWIEYPRLSLSEFVTDSIHIIIIDWLATDKYMQINLYTWEQVKYMYFFNLSITNPVYSLIK